MKLILIFSVKLFKKKKLEINKVRTFLNLIKNFPNKDFLNSSDVQVITL
jgi:hypothetical protein